MTDKEYREQKKRVKEAIKKWLRPMGMGWFRIDMVYCPERNIDDPRTAAMTHTDWQYRQATITWFLPEIMEIDDEHLEGIVVHEFVHVLVAPMMRVDKEDDLPLQHEYATETVARAIQWVYEAGKNNRGASAIKGSDWINKFKQNLTDAGMHPNDAGSVLWDAGDVMRAAESI